MARNACHSIASRARVRFFHGESMIADRAHEPVFAFLMELLTIRAEAFAESELRTAVQAYLTPTVLASEAVADVILSLAYHTSKRIIVRLGGTITSM